MCGRSSDGGRQGEVASHVLLWSFIPSPRKTKVKFSFFPPFYKMTFDDESDPFCGEVSLCRNYRDETFLSTIHAYLIISQTTFPFVPKILTRLCSFRQHAATPNMPARVEDEWSDSDEEHGSSGGVETNVQLGIPDGSITVDEDLKDPRVSRIGGHPVRFVHSHSYGCFPSLCSVLVPRFFLYPLPPMYPFRNAKTVRTLCNLSPRSGVRSKTVLWTARCISGLVPTGSARRRMEGTQTRCVPHEPAFDVDEAII